MDHRNLAGRGCRDLCLVMVDGEMPEAISNRLNAISKMQKAKSKKLVVKGVSSLMNFGRFCELVSPDYISAIGKSSCYKLRTINPE
jgi:hypothetical protein